MTRFNLLLITAGALAGLPGSISIAAPGYTPPTYAECVAGGRTGQACQRRIIEAGGPPRAVSNSTRTVTTRNFRGWTEHERWYRKYVEYCKRSIIRPQPIENVIHYYPDIPIHGPYYLVYP